MSLIQFASPRDRLYLLHIQRVACLKQQFALKKFSVCRDFSFATMGCANSVELCSSGEIKVKLHHVGVEAKMVKKMSKTLEESIIAQFAT